MEGDETLFWWRMASRVNPHLLGITTVLLWLLAAMAIRVRRRSDVPAVRDSAAVGLVFALLLALCGLFGVVARTQVLTTARPVVVMTENIELREGPNVAAKLKRTPPAMVPGTLMRVLEERDEWVKVGWHNDSGWTRSGAVQPVN